jgi:hypothetical protein
MLSFCSISVIISRLDAGKVVVHSWFLFLFVSFFYLAMDGEKFKQTLLQNTVRLSCYFCKAQFGQ